MSNNSIIPKKSIATKSLTVIVAIMSAFGVLTLGGIIVVNDGVKKWEKQISQEVTVQIKNISQTDISDTLEQTKNIVSEVEGVEEVRIVSDQEIKNLLEPWFGQNFVMEELPVPKLIAIKINNNVFEVDELKKSVSHIQGASVDDHKKWSRRLEVTANVVGVSGAVILTLVIIATVLTIVFATRGAIGSNAQIIEVMHFVGAEPIYIAKQFQKNFGRIAVKGAVAGAVVAASAFGALNVVVSQLVGNISITANAYFLVGTIIIIVTVTALAEITSRVTVLKHIRTIEPK